MVDVVQVIYPPPPPPPSPIVHRLKYIEDEMSKRKQVEEIAEQEDST